MKQKSKVKSSTAKLLKDNQDNTLFHWVSQKNVNPIPVSHAKGVYFWDTNGKQYLDFSSQLVNMNVGHGNKKIREAVDKQMQNLSHAHAGCMATEPRGLLGKKLNEITPKGLSKTFFTLCGTTSNDIAVMMARFYTGKHKIIAQNRSYHGTMHAGAALGGDPRRIAFDKHLMPGVVRVENPYTYRCPWGGQDDPKYTCKKALEAVEETIKIEGPGTIAAILMEGESGTSGCIKYPEGYLKGIRKLATKYGILMIVDEVMSGFGRCGNWFAIDNAGIVPDLLVVAKGLTSGYLPLGGVIVSDKIAKHFENHPFTAGMTYGAHPVSCAAALANLKVIEEEKLIDNCRKMGAYMQQQADIMKEKHPSIGDVRLTGLLGVIEVVKSKKTKEPMAPYNAGPDDMKVMNQVFAKLREQGLFTFARWNHIFIAPPLCVNKKQIDEGLEKISNALKIADKECK